MKLALGQELDDFLGELGDALKGKRQLDEPYVDKRTIIRALRDQNEVIRILQEKLVENTGKVSILEKSFQDHDNVISSLCTRVDSFQKTIAKVDVMENIIASWREKIEFLDTIALDVAGHSVSIRELDLKFDTQSKHISTLENKLILNITDIEKKQHALSSTVDDLPSSINITTSQVRHIMDGDNDDDVALVSDILNQREQQSQMLHLKVNTMKEILDSHRKTVQMIDNSYVDDLNKIHQDIRSITEWKDEQSNVCLGDLQRNLGSINLHIESMENDITEKISRHGVEEKLDNKFNEIIDHLQTALVSTQKDEADFKAVTSSLNKALEDLKVDKADKSDISKLRTQFIQNQVDNTGSGAQMQTAFGAPLEYEDIRRILQQYPTKGDLREILKEKVDKDYVHQSLHRSDNLVREMREDLETMLRQKEVFESSDSSRDNTISSKGVQQCNDDVVYSKQQKLTIPQHESKMISLKNETDSTRPKEHPPLSYFIDEQRESCHDTIIPSQKQVIVQLPRVHSYPSINNEKKTSSAKTIAFRAKSNHHNTNKVMVPQQDQHISRQPQQSSRQPLHFSLCRTIPEGESSVQQPHGNRDNDDNRNCNTQNCINKEENWSYAASDTATNSGHTYSDVAITDKTRKKTKKSNKTNRQESGSSSMGFQLFPPWRKDRAPLRSLDQPPDGWYNDIATGSSKNGGKTDVKFEDKNIVIANSFKEQAAVGEITAVSVDNQVKPKSNGNPKEYIMSSQSHTKLDIR